MFQKNLSFFKYVASMYKACKYAFSNEFEKVHFMASSTKILIRQAP